MVYARPAWPTVKSVGMGADESLVTGSNYTLPNSSGHRGLLAGSAMRSTPDMRKAPCLPGTDPGTRPETGQADRELARGHRALFREPQQGRSQLPNVCRYDITAHAAVCLYSGQSPIADPVPDRVAGRMLGREGAGRPRTTGYGFSTTTSRSGEQTTQWVRTRSRC